MRTEQERKIEEAWDMIIRHVIEHAKWRKGLESTPQRCAIYARVTRKTAKDELDQQVASCMRFIAGREPWTLDATMIFCDRGRDERPYNRPGFNQLLAHAERRDFDLLVVTRPLKNLFPSPDLHQIEALKALEERLKQAGVQCINPVGNAENQVASD
jgi:predicted site-specific integrase-resolvase